MKLVTGRGLLLAVFGLFFLVGATPALSQTRPSYPALTGRVVDAANILPPDTEAALTARLQALETRTGRQLVVATVPSLGGQEIEEYGIGLARTWAIGQRGRNDGAVMIVAPVERRVRVEVGTGLEPVLPDILSGRIIRDQVLPRFRAGDMPGGVTVGVDALIAHLTADPEAQREAVADANTRQTASGSIWPIIFTVIIIWLVISMIRGAFGGRGRRGRYRGSGGILPGVIIGSGLGRGGWGGGGGGGWSGGGGGGFSGGGGSFGGGGASGGW